MAVSMQNDKKQWTTLLNEIIDNAADLPLDCQEWVLALAKGMTFTRYCLSREGATAGENEGHM